MCCEKNHNVRIGSSEYIKNHEETRIRRTAVYDENPKSLATVEMNERNPKNEKVFVNKIYYSFWTFSTTRN